MFTRIDTEPVTPWPNSEHYKVERSTASERTYVFRFTVMGKGEFPFDMLRYDSCCPTDSDSVLNLHVETATGPRKPRDARSVTLRTVKGDKRWRPTYKRWASFGWVVT